MAFKIDVLISYAAADNLTEDENEKGWVSDFKYFLELMLEQVLGEKPTVALKEEGDTLTAANLEDVAVLIPVLSPNFISSGHCLDLLEEFGRNAEGTGAQRIFKVMKAPLSSEEIPTRLRDIHGYEMYKMDQDTGIAVDYSDYFDTEATNNYWMHIVDIAFDVHESIIMLTSSKKGAKTINTRKCIYLAETAHDLIVQRNIIRRELQRHGYKVLPDHPLPSTISEAEKQVKDYLDQCSLSVHLIGTSYGDIPDGTDKSIVDIQNKLAADKAGSEGKYEFPRLIWITPLLRSASEKQRTFIENVKRDSDVSEGAEILQTPLEDFKNMIRTEVIEGGLDRKKEAVHADEESNGRTSIYLIHDKVDTDKASGLRNMLEKSGFNVLLPRFEGELLDVREDHISNLRKFDGAIVFQGNVNRQWVRMKVLDLLKAPGFGRRKPVRGRALISPDSTGYELFTNQGIKLIEDDGDMKNNLDSFLEDIKS